jgi:hypothetical protein
MGTTEIHINLDAKCKRCGKGGATQSGYCLDCIIKRIDEGEYDHIFEAARKRLWGKKRAKRR